MVWGGLRWGGKKASSTEWGGQKSLVNASTTRGGGRKSLALCGYKGRAKMWKKNKCKGREVGKKRAVIFHEAERKRERLIKGLGGKDLGKALNRGGKNKY